MITKIKITALYLKQVQLFVINNENDIKRFLKIVYTMNKEVI